MVAAAKYPDSTKTSMEQRLHARARERWPQIASLHIRHHGNFSYIDATLTDATTLKLCRLRYVGSAHQWQFAIYRASHDDYDESVFPTGLPIGTCQQALDTACGLYLNDPTAWTGPSANLRARPLSYRVLPGFIGNGTHIIHYLRSSIVNDFLQRPRISAGRRAIIYRASRGFGAPLWPNARAAVRMFIHRRPRCELPHLPLGGRAAAGRESSRSCESCWSGLDCWCGREH
jgi:hypothetical protein